jgi:hypothetical protein
MAAQKAFFQAALSGKPVEAPAPAREQTNGSTRHAASTQTAAADRIPPPGSIINILV